MYAISKTLPEYLEGLERSVEKFNAAQESKHRGLARPTLGGNQRSAGNVASSQDQTSSV